MIEQLARALEPVSLAPGEVLFHAGDAGDRYYLVEDGSVRISPPGREDVTLEAGAGFGEIALITEGPRTATVTAETELKCYGLTPWEFRPLVQTNASIAWKILQALAKQVEQRH